MNKTVQFAVLAAVAAMGSQAAIAQDAMAKKEVNAVTLVDGLEGVFGTNAGAKRSGAKGFCAKGTFTGNKAASAVSAASAFNGKSVPVTIRYSIGGGNPNAPDNGKTVRGMALQFDLPGGEKWLMANINTPVFTAATPESFQAFLDARKPDPATKKPDPAKIKAATDANPDHKLQAAFLASRDVPASYGAQNYWGVNAFKMTNAKGQSQMVRWVFEPVGGEEFIKAEKAATMPALFLKDELAGRLSQDVPVNFTMKLQLAEKGDPSNNATVTWPAERKTVDAGTLSVTALADDASCQAINFNPLVLPKGVEPSDDPLLPARAGAYAVSQSRR